MGNIAIIPARGGSKRIPGKNIKDFLGKPIIAYSIEAALNSGLFTEVMVSTDSEEIAEVARKYGAKVPFMRSSKNADDNAGTMEVIKEVIEDYQNKFHNFFNYTCCIYPTAPLISRDDLKHGLELLRNGKFDVVFPIVPFTYPIWRGLKIVNGKTRMLWPENLMKRSQDLEMAYHDAGQWYWLDMNKSIDKIFTENTASIILKEENVQDIDTITDWRLAEIKFKLLYE